jgi:hypothetical protein
VPIFISKPNMLDCEAEWRDKLVGMQPSNADDTVLDIEPYTGYSTPPPPAPFRDNPPPLSQSGRPRPDNRPPPPAPASQ